MRPFYISLIPAIAFATMPRATRAQASRVDSVPKGEALQVVDTEFVAKLRRRPTFAAASGPIVSVDEWHHNFHTAFGRYRPFSRLLEADGFRVRASNARFDDTTLAATRILVIANALNENNQRPADWHLPALGAFDSTEIAVVNRWVRRGGSLLLITDHMPFPGAVTALAATFGIHFANGFALWGSSDPATGDFPIVFRRSDGTLGKGPITNGRTPSERIDSLQSFTGSAFRLDAPSGAEIMRLPVGTQLMMPVMAWRFSDSTATMAADGMLQGAAVKVGRGRVAVFAEAGMFTAQRKGPQRMPMGMNAPAASQNPQFILNVMHWLAVVIE